MTKRREGGFAPQKLRTGAKTAARKRESTQAERGTLAPRLYARLLAEFLALVQSRDAELSALTPELWWPCSFRAELPGAKAGTVRLNLAAYVGFAPSRSAGWTVLGMLTSTSRCSQR